MTLRQAVLFVGSNGVTMWVLQPLADPRGAERDRVPLMVAKVLALGGTVVANFLLYRYVVWPDRGLDGLAGGATGLRR